MGNQPNIRDPSRRDNQFVDTNSLEYLTSKNHHLFGKIQLWKLKNVLSKQPTVFSIVVYNQSPSSQQPQHPNLFYYYGCYAKENQYLFASEYQLYFEYCSATLRKVIDYTTDRQNIPPEKTIWKFINQIVDVCAYLETQNYFHSDIRPETLFFDRNKQLKILPYGMYGTQQTGYAKTMAYTAQSLLSPYLMKSLRKRIMNPQSNPYKDDVYSLGMTLLELVTQTNSAIYYDYLNGTINFGAVEGGFRTAISNKYSQQLIDFIGLTLQYEESARPTFLELKNKTPGEEQFDGRSSVAYSDLRLFENSIIFSQPSVVRMPTQLSLMSPKIGNSYFTSPRMSQRSVILPFPSQRNQIVPQIVQVRPIVQQLNNIVRNRVQSEESLMGSDRKEKKSLKMGRK